MAESVRRAAETIIPLGMSPVLQAVWRDKNRFAGEAIVLASDVSSGYGGVSRFLRMTLQSMSLALGAYLVIHGDATGGVMIASSILLGRALAPVELAISHWRSFVGARQAYRRLEAALEQPATEPQTRLPPPSRGLSVESLFVALPGQSQPFLQDIRFELQSGDALGVIGPSGSGKSALARTMVGVWTAAKGAVRLDGSTLDQWSQTDRGRFLGYLPQEVELFAGSIGQNISRFNPEVSIEPLLAAAEAAGLSEFIRALPGGFEAPAGERGSLLSVGQRQRVALARALYGDPFLLVLDEPNSALDAEGEAALSRAIVSVRERGGIVVIAAHRPSALQATNKTLVLIQGQQQGFGPRDEVLKRVLAPAAPVASTRMAS